MSYALQNTETSDGYTPAATLLCGGARSLLVTVANAAAAYRLGHGFAAPVWDTEQNAVPGVWTLPGADAIQLRSLAAGRPAQVMVTAF